MNVSLKGCAVHSMLFSTKEKSKVASRPGEKIQCRTWQSTFDMINKHLNGIDVLTNEILHFLYFPEFEIYNHLFRKRKALCFIFKEIINSLICKKETIEKFFVYVHPKTNGLTCAFSRIDKGKSKEKKKLLAMDIPLILQSTGSMEDCSHCMFAYYNFHNFNPFNLFTKLGTNTKEKVCIPSFPRIPKDSIFINGKLSKSNEESQSAIHKLTINYPHCEYAFKLEDIMNATAKRTNNSMGKACRYICSASNISYKYRILEFQCVSLDLSKNQLQNELENLKKGI